MSFDYQPTLKGRLLELRPLKAGDFAGLFAVAADPLLWLRHPDKHRYRREVFAEFFGHALDSGGALVACDLKDGRIIGSSRFHGYNEERSEIEIGWSFLARSYWGGRYNGEMKGLMLGHAFRYVDNVIFLVDRDNIRSRKAVEKIGGVYVESRIGPVTGGEAVVYRITAAEFVGRTGE